MYINTASVPGLIVDWDIMKQLATKYFPRERRSASVSLNHNGYPMFDATMRGEMRRHKHLIHDLVAIFSLQQQGYSGTFLPVKPQRWVVHHINANKLDARPKNLVALPEKVHNKLHSILGEIARHNSVELHKLIQFTAGAGDISDFSMIPQEAQEALQEVKATIDDYITNAATYINEEYRKMVLLGTKAT